MTTFNWHWWEIHRGRRSVTIQETSACHRAGKLVPLKSHKITCRNVLCFSVDDMPSSINQQIFMLNACSITTASMKVPLCWPKCSCEWCSGKGQGDLCLTFWMQAIIPSPLPNRKINESTKKIIIEHLLCVHILSRLIFLLIGRNFQTRVIPSFFPFCPLSITVYDIST